MVLFTVLQVFIQWQIQFNISICDPFAILRNSDFTSQSDDDASYLIRENSKEATLTLENASKKINVIVFR